MWLNASCVPFNWMISGGLDDKAAEGEREYVSFLCVRKRVSEHIIVALLALCLMFSRISMAL